MYVCVCVSEGSGEIRMGGGARERGRECNKLVRILPRFSCPVSFSIFPCRNSTVSVLTTFESDVFPAGRLFCVRFWFGKDWTVLRGKLLSGFVVGKIRYG